MKDRLPPFRHTTLILIGCIALSAGIGLARSGFLVSRFYMPLGLLLLLPGLPRRRLVTGLGVVLLSFSLGSWRGSLYMHYLSAYQPLYSRQATVTVRALGDAVYGSHAQISFDADNVQLVDGTSLHGKLTLSGFGPGAVHQGDIIQASGKLYPGKGAYQGRMSFAKLQIVSRHPTLVAQLRRQFAAGLQSSLPEPLAPFAMGLLIGQRATLPAGVKQDLLIGLTHIIAVSGYNLTIMLQASRRLLGDYSKRLSTSLSLGLLAVFLLLAGLSASIVRAAIVSVLSIMTSYYGGSFRPLNLILLAAAITAWANPFYVWGDASWYLSFLAFLGVLIVAPLLSEKLPLFCQKSLPITVAVESLSAEMMTLPFVLHTFGQMSFIGLPANVLVVSLVPLAMLLSLLAGLSGMLVSGIAGWLAWPANLLLTYMLDTAHLFARIPHVFAQNLNVSGSQMVALYLIIILIVVLLTKHARQVTTLE